MVRGCDIPREQLEAGWEAEEDQLNEKWLCKRCGHSYAQHTKGPVKDKYCRHCPCHEFQDTSCSNATISNKGD